MAVDRNGIANYKRLGLFNAYKPMVLSLFRSLIVASAHAWLTPSPLLHRTVRTLPRMRQIFAKQLNRYRRASAGFTGGDDIRKKVTRVVTIGLLTTGRHNRWATDRHSLTI